ncbi:aldehyde dehydrogenase [NAD(P)+]-like protein [Xylariales sp. PMI_506]|nr:aldehyde dehydrogenase [NAD(P)+]-like protein [Xylariales sp. PMI_506]
MATVELSAPNGVKWTQPLGLFINNEWVNSSDGKSIPTVNPTTETEICAPQAASAQDVDSAVKAARAAFRDPSWKSLDGTARGLLLLKLADLIEANANLLSSIDTLDSGKPFVINFHYEVKITLERLRYYAGYADKIHGQVMDCGPGKLAYTIKTPVGVVGQILPWNFNIGSFVTKIAPAIACGNTVVLKASETAPLVVLYLATLVKEAGFPPGVINIINGLGAEAGAAIAAHPDVDKISFTGSTATAKEIQRLAAGNLKGLTFETGGKSPAIVFDDADLDNAALWSNFGMMALSGQICSANSRILVQRGVYEAFLAKFVEQVGKVCVLGDPFEQTTFNGPLVSRTQYEKVLGYVESARSEGATIHLGGRGAPRDGKGFWVEPTIFTEVKPHMRVFREEIFGPCVVIVPFDTEEEGLKLANDSTYGLMACVFTNSIARGHRVAREFEAGSVFINTSNALDARVPFGGTKQSGIGTELGEAGLSSYFYTKAVHLNMLA